MKKNLPVIDHEIVLNDGDELITTTDLKGAITFMNDAFERISEFSVEECLGKNHNLVRHPDVPAAAFEDLWKHVKAGKPWRGIVKNRCKTGRYYWVDAYVTPIFERGQVCGYESVRKKASPQQIVRAKRLYAALNAGKGLPGKPWITFGLRAQFAVCAAVAVIPVVVTGLLTANVLAVLSVACVSALVAFGLFSGVTQDDMRVVELSQTYVNNPITQYLYTGNYRASGQLEFAMSMLSTKISTILTRVKGASEETFTHIVNQKTAISTIHQEIDQLQHQIEAMAIAMTELNASIQDISHNASHATQQVEVADSCVQQGQLSVQTAANDIRMLSEEVEAAASTIAQLDQDSVNIGAVVESIEGVANQTNLLALNAAIEAARAGEQGRGFAVVADEVRTLASRTQQSTEEIQTMIAQLQAGTQSAVKTMMHGKERAEANVSNAAELEAVLQQIQAAFRNINDVSNSIDVATREQSMASSEVSQNIDQVNAASQVAVAHASGLLEDGEKLLRVAQGLSDLIVRFK